LAGEREAAARFRAALAAKEEVEARLESDLAAARAQAASYEHRWGSWCRLWDSLHATPNKRSQC
jgi:hypothetical protein